MTLFRSIYLSMRQSSNRSVELLQNSTNEDTLNVQFMAKRKRNMQTHYRYMYFYNQMLFFVVICCGTLVDEIGNPLLLRTVLNGMESQSI